jgi:hypothetical protein
MFVRSLGALAVVCVLAATAAAQDKPDFELAKRHYLAAKEAQSRGDTDGAVRSYILAYDITKDPTLFKQIAQAYEAGGKKPEAAVYYRRYLAEAKSGADADDVRARIAALTGSPARPAEPPPKRGALPPEPPKLPPEPPPSEPSVVTPLPSVPSSPLPEGPRAGWQRTAAWVSVGLAAVALTTGTVLATSSLSREEDVRRLIEFREPNDLPSRYQGSVRDDYETKDDEGRKLSRYATVSFITAGGLAGAAVLFFILDATRDVERPAAAIAPMVGPGGAGLTAGWTF